MRKIQVKRRYRITRLRRLRNRLKKLLDGLALNGLYELYETTTDEILRKKVEQRILEMDDLSEIILNETDPLRTRAWGELNSKIKNGEIKKSRARRILKRAMSVPELRKETWGLFTTLDPTDEELKEIQKLDFIYSEPSIAHDIEQLLRKRHKRKNRTAKIVKEIQGTVEKINKIKGA